jgi:endonuclease/exonuclease/phosphatase family metal-dependent hydrolase
MKSFRALSYNIHKGFAMGNRRLVSEGIRSALHKLDPEVVFMQEVVGQNDLFAARFTNWPAGAQHEFFCSEALCHRAYGKNSTYDEGHHGNAILSQFPFAHEINIDVSVFSFEPRGFLHVSMPLGGDCVLHALCVHLGLFEYERRIQMQKIAAYVRRHVPQRAPLLIVGDFNDWRMKLHEPFKRTMELREAFEDTQGSPARSFPSQWPFSRLDRIYYRNLELVQAHRLFGMPWKELSDHIPLMAEFSPAGT